MRQLRFTLTLILTLMITMVLGADVRVNFAQADFLGNCTHAPDSRITRPDGVVIRNEYRNQRLVLASIASGDVAMVLDTSINTAEIAFLDWSPDCRLLFGSIERDAVIWDAVNGGRVAVFENVDAKNPPYWNPGRDNLILETQQGSFLWNFRYAEPRMITYAGEYCSTNYRYFDWQVEWDNANNQVLVVPNFVDGNVVIVYDQMSAQQVAAYDNACQQGPIKFRVTADNRHVIVFTSESEAFAGFNKAITVWNRGTMTHVTVDANNQSAVLPNQVALSPDGSLLVLARLGGLRVWDLTTLAESVQARDPIRRYPIAPNTWSTRFFDATTVETTDFNGMITRWDLGTGGQVE